MSNPRVSFKPTDRAFDAMDTAIELTGDNLTDTCNRALVIYARLLQETRDREPNAAKGSVIVYLTDKADADSTEQVEFI